jgi:CopA family copper-resistance protein
MKNIFLIAFGLALYSLGFAQVTITYTCPMHPEIHAAKPGNCPKCGMKLIKKKPKAVKQPVVKKQKEMKMLKDTSRSKLVNMGVKDTMPMNPNKKEQPVTYTCPMHPEIHAGKPGNCPKCGMKLVVENPKAITIPSNNNQEQAFYTCPMHPEIHAEKPGNCPKCGMKLVKEKHEGHANSNLQDSMQMPMNDDDKKIDSMYGMDSNAMQMGNNGATMQNIKRAKANLGSIKTIINNTAPHTVRYDLYVTDTIVNFSGKSKRAIAVNGQIPMPALIFTEGDTAEIYVHNNLKEETSLHWHGLFLPNRYDGVPNLTQMPIKPGTTHLYKFPIIQHGTHWYHSHTRLQEQIGMYGAFIMNKRDEWDIPTLPVVISEWTDMKPGEVDRSLHTATDWFAIKKGSTQSYSEAIKKGHFNTKLTNEWKRMNAMDVSDVYYDKFLINGQSENSWNPLSGSKGAVRLRIANAGASSYFWLTYAGGKITVVATDGNDVEPVEVDRLIIAVSETYDVVVTIPSDSSAFEFLATSEDRTKSTSLWLGNGIKRKASPLPRLKYFAGMKMMNDMMDMHGNMVEMEGMKMQNQVMDMNTVMYPEITGPENAKKAPSHLERAGGEADNMPGMKMEEKMQMNHTGHKMAGMNMAEEADIVTLNYTMLRASAKTTLPAGPLKELKFDLTGNMNRYVWTLNNKAVSESDRILIKKGENLRIILFNNSMMRHPMHLHGHDFRVLNGQGEYAPMKNVIDIMPMERDTIEFAASEAGGDWFFHCHILYHMMSGMGRIFRYENSPANPEIPDPKLAQRKLFADDRMFHFMARIGIESNGSDGEAMIGNTRWKASSIWHLGYHDMHGYESETMIGRYLGRNQWLYPYIGFDYHYKVEGGPKNIFGGEEKNWFGQKSNKNNRKTVIAGIAYTLPMLVLADARIDGNGKFRFQLSREDIPIAPRLRFNWMINTDKEYMAGFRYILTKYFSLSTHYDSDMGLGAGITLTY